MNPADLRRADWRFLLPPAAPEERLPRLLVAGGPSGLAGVLVDLRVAEAVEPEDAQSVSVDSIAVLSDARHPLERLVARLRPGGNLYYELDRRQLRHLGQPPAVIARRLRRLGLRVTGTYWAKPDFAHCEMYLPLHVRDGLGWYLRSLYTAITPQRRALELFLRAIARSGSQRLQLFAPCVAIVAQRPGPKTVTAPAVLLADGMPRSLRSPDLQPILFTDAGERVVMLPVDKQYSRPAGVLKVPKLPGQSDKSSHEQHVLERVRACVDPDLRRSIPLPLGRLSWAGVSVAVESHIDGRQLLTTSGRWGLPLRAKVADLDLAGGWIGRFHRQACVARANWDSEAQGRWLEAALVEFERTFGLREHERACFERVRAQAAELSGKTLPLVWQHNDFGLWNLSRTDDGGLGVIDWEGGRIGPPLCDLLYLATHWAITAQTSSARGQPDELRTFSHVFLEPTRAWVTKDAVWAVVARYLAALELDARFLPMFLVLTWVQLALGRHRRAVALQNLQPDPRADNPPLHYLECLSHHMDELLATSATETLGRT